MELQFGYRRNKRDIEKTIEWKGKTYNFIDTLPYNYNKALLYKNDNVVLLMSYETIVAQAIENTSITAFGYYSKTTARHINDFFEIYGKNKLSKKELEEMGQTQKYLYL